MEEYVSIKMEFFVGIFIVFKYDKYRFYFDYCIYGYFLFWFLGKFMVKWYVKVIILWYS